MDSRITIQVYFNLEDWQKRQLFIEINGKSKKVTKNLAVQYDDRNSVNTLITDLLKNSGSALYKMGIETEKSRIVRPNNTKWLSMTRLSRFVSFLLFGTGNVSSSNNQIVREQYEEIFAFLQQYFNFLESSLPKEPGNVKKNILAHEALQNAIALVCHKNIINNVDGKISFDTNWKGFVEMLEYVDFEVTSSLFREQLVLLGGNNEYYGFSDSKHHDLVPLLMGELNQLLK